QRSSFHQSFSRGRCASIAMPHTFKERTDGYHERHDQTDHRQGLWLYRDSQWSRVLLPSVSVRPHAFRSTARRAERDIYGRSGSEGAARGKRQPAAVTPTQREGTCHWLTGQFSLQPCKGGLGVPREYWMGCRRR